MAGRRVHRRAHGADRLMARRSFLLDTSMLLGIITDTPWAQRARSECNLDDPRTVVTTSVVCHGEIMAISERRKWSDKKRKKLVKLLYEVPASGINRQPILNAYTRINVWTHGGSVVDQQAPPPKPAVSMTDNDIWIATTAHVTDATLLSTDRDFEHLHSVWIDFIYVDQRSR